MANQTINTYLLGKDSKININSSGYAELGILNGDIETSNYRDNITAALNRRLFSIVDELVLHSDYGGFISSYVSEILNLSFVNLIKIMMRTEILRDPRVEEVSEIKITYSKTNRTVIFSYSVETITQQNINNIIFEIPVID